MAKSDIYDEVVEAFYNLAKEYFDDGKGIRDIPKAKIASLIAELTAELASKMADGEEINPNSCLSIIDMFYKTATGGKIGRGLKEDHELLFMNKFFRDYSRDKEKLKLASSAWQSYIERNYANDTPKNNCIRHAFDELRKEHGIPINTIGKDMVGKLFKDVWVIENTDDYKIHFAQKNNEGVQPLDACAADPHAWWKWQEFSPAKNDFNKKYIFSLMEFYEDEKYTWLFGGIFEVLDRVKDERAENGFRYIVKLTEQMKEYIGRLKLHLPRKHRMARQRMEPSYSQFKITEVSDEPYFTIAEKSVDDEHQEKIDRLDGSEREKFKDYTIQNIIDEGCFIERNALEKIFDRFEEKKNLILQGPPGTGKTWLAKRLGYALIGKKDKENLISVQFHPTMSYEDFVMGYRPSDSSEESTLERVDGIFLEFAEKARKNPNENYVLVIEEINRGNPAQIFGELLTLLEKDKRKPEEALRLCYHKESESFYIPENLYVIGTMNLADRSLAMVDLALRRRFAFEDLEPAFNDAWIEFVNRESGIDSEFLGKVKIKMEAMNEKIMLDKTLGKQFCIGHSFFTTDEKIHDSQKWYKEIIRTEIVPLLEEYWLDAPADDDDDDGKSKVEKIKDELEDI